VLELAAGTGEVGFLAAEQIAPTGTLISSDFAPEMITVAQARAEKLGITNVRFRQIDAESIDQPAASLDGVLCRWGYMLMADPEAALRETRRILKPGARLALAAWPGRRRTRGRRCRSGELIERGHVERPEPGAPGQFRWARPGTIEEHLDAAGFTEYEVDTGRLRATSTPRSTPGSRSTRDCSMMLRSALEQLDPAEREDVIAAIREKALPVRARGRLGRRARAQLGRRRGRLAHRAPQPLRRLAVGGEERLDRQLLDGDVGRRPERRDRC
jgi:SAM-dependent methyltransferase